MESATLSSKNQITVPSQVRRELRIGSGDRIRFEPTRDGRFIVEPVPTGVRSDGAAKRRLSKMKRDLETVDIETAIRDSVLKEDQRIREQVDPS